MKQLISYYRMPGDREEEILRLIHAEGLDGVETSYMAVRRGVRHFANHCGNASQVLALLDGSL